MGLARRKGYWAGDFRRARGEVSKGAFSSVGASPPSPAAHPPGPPSVPRSSGAPGGRRRRLRTLGAVVGAVAVAVVVLLAAVHEGWFASHARSDAVPSASAISGSQSVAQSDLGGNWTVLAAVGVEQRISTAVTLENLSSLLGTDCSPRSWNSSPLPSSIIVPAYGGSFSSGLSPFWMVFLAQGSTSTVAAIEDLNGTSSPVALVGGTGCPVDSSSFSPLPRGAVDSSTAASVAWDAAGASWVARDGNLSSVTMIAVGGGSYDSFAVPSSWVFDYAPCDPLGGGTVSETSFVAILNLTVGAFTASTTYSLDCP